MRAGRRLDHHCVRGVDCLAESGPGLSALARSTLSACGSWRAGRGAGRDRLTGFDSAFRNFHLLFFTNDLWQLSSRDGLIQLFPAAILL